jgi:hypothetical protein
LIRAHHSISLHPRYTIRLPYTSPFFSTT